MEKMVEGGLEDKPILDKTINIRFESASTSVGALVQFTDAFFHYPDSPNLYEDLNFGITNGAKIALVGPNGVGKSTLLKLIAGEIEPTEGVMRRSPHVKVGRYHQHFMEQLDMNQTPLEWMIQEFSDPIEQTRAHLGRFGLNGPAQKKPLGQLSGGQKARVAFSYIARLTPDLMLLDEPTNHLDMETIDGLSKAINEFNGAILVVSHDTRLIKNISNQIFLVKDKNVTRYDGTIMDYRKTIIEEMDLDLEA